MVRLEVCVDSPSGLQAAIEGGADRIELCSALALALGGLAPGPGLIQSATNTDVPIIAMIRPRAGDFCWTKAELSAARDDIAAIRAAGLAGVAIGANLEDGGFDWRAITALSAAADGLQICLHRSVDLAPDPVEAVAGAKDLGIMRILSSGGAPTALAGLKCLVAMGQAAGEDVSVMPGSGLNDGNVA